MNAEYWWQKNTPELAKSYRVVALDLRGHGLSGKTGEGHTLAQYARDLRHLCEALDLAGVILVGWSMGPPSSSTTSPGSERRGFARSRLCVKDQNYKKHR